MNLDFDLSRWEHVRRVHRQWWAGDLDRPLIHLTLVGRDPGRQEPDLPRHEFASFYDEAIPAEAIVDRWLYDLECRRFAGDAFPQVFPNFGPGVIAALMGLELLNGNGTVWFQPSEPLALEEVHFEFDRGNRWFRRLCDLYRAATERFEGMVQLGMTDLGGNLDIVHSFRPGERLLLDLHDDPERVETLVRGAHEMWWRYFEELDRIIQGGHQGYSAWTPIYSEDPYYILQSDFCFMIGPKMFERFVKPELSVSARKLTNAFYHLDGPGQLTHLDSVLAIEDLAGVQWVPGAGQPGVTEWPEVYRRIHRAGKRIQFFTGQDELGIDTLDRIVDQLGEARGLVMIGEVPIEQEPRVEELLERYGV